MLHDRKRTISVLGGLATLAVCLAPLTPSHAEPDIDDVRAKVDRLYHEAEVATERYHDANTKLGDLRKDLEALKADEREQAARVASIQSQVDQAVSSQYEGQMLSAAGELMLSDDPEKFLTDLTHVDAYNGAQADVMSTYRIETDALKLRRDAVAERAAELAKTQQTLRKQKETADAKARQAKQELAKLEESQLRALDSQISRGTTTRVTPEIAASAPVAASGRAGAAVAYALAQVGDSYVYGAMGPDAFDCSGLTMRAWQQAGVSLPHSSRGQMGSGARVSRGALQPGDLVFYYSPVSHVGIYIGGGRIVHAANPRTGVAISGVNSMPYSGAVRPG